LDRIMKNDCLSRKKALKSHCFQDIAVEYLPDEVEAVKDGGFQRISFVGPGNPFPDSPNVSARNERKLKASDVENQAYIQGFAKGEKAGMESGENKFKPVLNNFRQAFLELEKVRKEIYLHAEKKTVNLALAIAKKVVCHEIATNKEVVFNVIKEAVKKVVNHGRIIIKISPSDLRFIKNSDHGFLNFVDNIENITFEEDETISDGGCVIETDFGNIDARIERQFQVVEEAFKSEIQRSISEG